MDYTQLIETVSLIVETEKIVKRGLTLVYELPEKEHNELNEVLFLKTNQFTSTFTPSEEFEIMLGGLLVKFKKSK